MVKQNFIILRKAKLNDKIVDKFPILSLLNFESFLKMKNILIFNAIFILTSRLFCLLGLIYHTSQLFDGYWQGKTVVNIKIERDLNYTLPAITICYPYSISFKKISQLNEKYQDSYNTYLGHLFNNSFYKSNFDLVKMRNIYHSVINEVFEQINNFSLNINQVFNNYSIDLNNDQGDTILKIMFNRFDVTNKIGHPIESFEINKNHFGEWKNEKCFTYFSSLDKTWRKTYMDISEIYVSLNYSLIDFPLNEPSKVSFAIHSPNALPNMNDENFEYLSMGHSYTSTYSLLSTKLLGSGYDTNCHNYDIDYKFHNKNMRSDCFTWCYQRSKNVNNNYIFQSWFLLRKEVLSHVKNFSNSPRVFQFNNPLNKRYGMKKYCNDKCRKDCIFTYYSTNTKLDQINTKGDFDIFILHNNLPDIIITYLPQVTFLTLVCDFGGLLGMWLGISILVMIEDLTKILKIFTRKSINIYQIKMGNKISRSKIKNHCINILKTKA